MTEPELIELLAEAISQCSEFLNGVDQALDAFAAVGGPSTKSPLTTIADNALEEWRKWKFG